MVYYKATQKKFPQGLTEITESLTKEKSVPGPMT
jgi:hypothetical protein